MARVFEPLRPLRGRGVTAPLAGALFALCLLGAVPSGTQAQVVVRDDRGAEVALAAPPQRIVSLLPSLTESVCALGACARLVGTDRYSNWPASVDALPKLGGLDDVQIERVVALRPDLVVLPSSARVTDRLEALGLKVVVLDSRQREDVHRSLLVLGTLLGVPAEAGALWARIEAESRAAAARVPKSMRGQRVYFEIDATPYAAGPTSFIGDALARLGLGNIAEAPLGPFPKLNPEFVVRAQPGVIMASEANLRSMAKRPGWAGLQALQQGRTCGFAPALYELLVRPGPRMGEAARVLADCLATIAARR